MIKPLKIKQTESSPEVLFSPKRNIFRIKGRCIQENPISFFDTLSDWFIKYEKLPNPETEIIVDIDYMNSTATRRLVKLIRQLELLEKENVGFKIIWMCQKDDAMMLKKGEEFKKTFQLNFEIKCY